jgi:hypothetical protein
MNRFLITPLGAASVALGAFVCLLSLTACFSGSAPTTPVAIPNTATPTPQPEATNTPTSEAGEIPDLVTSTPTPEVTPTEPVAEETIPATMVVSISPLATPTPERSTSSSAETETASRELAPDFTLDSAQEAAVTLSDYRVEPSNVVLIFYRGQT